MMSGLRLRVVVVFCCVLLTFCYASTSSDAEKAYRAEDYATAELLYAKLLRSSPSNRIYNHRYGVSLCEQEKDFAIAEKHLIKSKSQGIHLSYLYLGRVCFKQYKFDDAIAYYNAYLKKSTDKENKVFVSDQLPYCEKGKDMLSRTEDVTIIDRIVVDRENFFTSYNVTSEVGSFSNDVLAISEDSIPHNSTIYRTERGDRVFFSAINSEGVSDLYSKNKLLDKWSERSSLGDNVNTAESEAYPYLMPDGVVLYFSSKGHDGLGGYDIFVTRYNASQNAYLPPRQLGMPFNSPSDDLLFVVDEYNNIGYFASDRDTDSSKIAIYMFRPNTGIKLLNTDDDLLRRQSAMLSDYSAFDSASIEVNITSASEHEEVESHPIYFVLNDTLIYTSLDDFMNADARQKYIEYEESVLNYNQILSELDNKRRSYSTAINSDEKQTLISDLTVLENSSISADENNGQLLNSTRRIELQTIIDNGGYLKPKPSNIVSDNVIKVDQHASSWESTMPGTDVDLIDKPFFYSKTLNTYYSQLFSDESIVQLVESHKMRTHASNRQFFADYIMREYNRDIPEEGFYEKTYAYDTTLTPQLTQQELLLKVDALRHEAMLNFIESAYLNFYTLKGQNVILLESVSDNNYRNELIALMDKANFSLQQADQKIYESEGVYTESAQNMSQGNNHLKDGVQFLEAFTQTYLKYRYEKQKGLLDVKPQPNSLAPTVEAVVATADVVEVNNAEQTKTVFENAAQEYRIQIALYSRLLSDDEMKVLPDMSYVLYKESPKLYKYFTGHYASRVEAAMALESVKVKGYKDAFIVEFENGKMTE